MKSFAGFIPASRRAWHREKLLELLGGEESLLDKIEQAENHYLFFLPRMAEGKETDKQIKIELEALTAALKTLHAAYTPGGSAKALFEGEAVGLVGAEILFQLRDAVSGHPGELLIQASAAAADEFSVRESRKPESGPALRFELVDRLAQIAEEAGIDVQRNGRDGQPSTFNQLLQFAYDRVGIDVKPDGDIRAILAERRANP